MGEELKGLEAGGHYYDEIVAKVRETLLLRDELKGLRGERYYRGLREAIENKHMEHLDKLSVDLYVEYFCGYVAKVPAVGDLPYAEFLEYRIRTMKADDTTIPDVRGAVEGMIAEQGMLLPTSQLKYSHY